MKHCKLDTFQNVFKDKAHITYLTPCFIKEHHSHVSHHHNQTFAATHLLCLVHARINDRSVILRLSFTKTMSFSQCS